VIEPIEMPAGALGFRISGSVSRRDYDEVLIPPIRAAIEAGEEVRCLCQLGPGFEGYEAGAVWEDIKTGADYGLGHHKAWKRIAIVTDVDWVRHLSALFGWLSPGEMKLFGLDELEAAKAWTAG
jgi:hypothetical protein